MNEEQIKNILEQNEELLEWRRILNLILQYSSKIKTMTKVKDILDTIADFTEEILQADRCTVFLIDEENNDIYSWVAHGMDSKEIRFPAGKGIAGNVAKTGEILNIKDAYKDKRFNPDIDKKTGYTTKTLLCMPMKNQLGHIIGVFQVINKTNGCFSVQDEEVIGLLSQQAAASIESAQLYEEVKRSFSSFINTLAETIDARDPMTAGHSHRVCMYSTLIAGNMDYDEDSLEVLKYAALLHDLGKIGVKEAVLTKPGDLTKEEFLHITKHAEITKKILEQTYFQPKFREIPVIASAHHEKLDGSGYPNHLKGDDIPMMARVMAVADVFDALTYRRHYRNPMSIEKVVNILKSDSGTKLEPRCVEALISTKICKILNIMINGAKSEAVGQEYEWFGEVTLGELSAMLETGEDNNTIRDFRKCYPVQFDE